MSQGNSTTYNHTLTQEQLDELQSLHKYNVMQHTSNKVTTSAAQAYANTINNGNSGGRTFATQSHSYTNPNTLELQRWGYTSTNNGGQLVCGNNTNNYEEDIQTNADNIAQNTADISQNTADITQNTADIETNTTNIATIPSIYETKANASATYETKANASATYETKANASATYETIDNASLLAPKDSPQLTGNVTLTSDNPVSVDIINVDGTSTGQANLYLGQSMSVGGGIRYDGTTGNDIFELYTRDTNGDNVFLSNSYHNNDVNMHGNLKILSGNLVFPDDSIQTTAYTGVSEGSSVTTIYTVSDSGTISLDGTEKYIEVMVIGAGGGGAGGASGWGSNTGSGNPGLRGGGGGAVFWKYISNSAISNLTYFIGTGGTGGIGGGGQGGGSSQVGSQGSQGGTSTFTVGGYIISATGGQGGTSSIGGTGGTFTNGFYGVNGKAGNDGGNNVSSNVYGKGGAGGAGGAGNMSSVPEDGAAGATGEDGCVIVTVFY